MSRVSNAVRGLLSGAGTLFLDGQKSPSVGLAATFAGRVWAQPGMRVTFRAEVMPGRIAPERTFTVAELLSGGRILVEGIAGEHAKSEFEVEALRCAGHISTVEVRSKFQIFREMFSSVLPLMNERSETV